MNLWIVTTDDSNGIRARPFTSEEAADAAALAWCKEDWPLEQPCPDNWRDAYMALRDFDDAIWMEEHTIDDSAAVAAIKQSAKAQLADLLEQVYQMQGMFSDDDGRIQRAIDDAEAWSARAG